MDFFKSVFSDDAEPQESPNSSPKFSPQEEPDSNPNPISPNTSSAWSFGGLMKTLTTKSESVLETYRRDLSEFSSGFKDETLAIRRAVKDLPGALDLGASVAVGKLELVGQAIDDLGTTVSGIIAHGKETLLSTDHDTDDREKFSGSSSKSPKYYTRFESQIRGVQSDLSTYCEDPEDLEEFGEWKKRFVLDEKEEEIEKLVAENGVVDNIYRKLVPSEIDDETLWSRYYYRIHKLKQVEDARAQIVRRAISGQEEEELSWDFDDDDKEEDVEGSKSGASVAVAVEKSESEKTGDVDSHRSSDVDGANVVENVDSCSKDSDISIISSQPTMPPEEEDMGWDDIEDLSSIDDKKGSVGDSPNKVDMCKRLSAADEEEDLSWDIEDEDEPVKP